MANKYNFKFGQQELVSYPVDSDTVIAAGDMVYLDTNDVKPAGDTTWDTNLATTQAAFADVFLGIALHASASGDTDNIDVDISATSVYEFTVASDTYEVGQLLGADKASGNALLSNALEDAVAASAVAVAFERKAASATTLRVKFASAFNPASCNSNISLG